MLLDQNGRSFAPPAPSDHEGAAELVLESFDSMERRADAWSNPITGIGTGADKTRHGHFGHVRRLWDPEIVDMINGSDLAAKAVFKRPEEMFREGYRPSAKDIDASAIDDFRDWADETYDLDNTFQDGSGWGGAFGGLLLVLGIDDGRQMWEPVDESRIRDVAGLAKVDRRFAYASSYYSDLMAPGGKYGQPETYLISNGVATSALGRRGQGDLSRSGFAVGIVHESRTIRFDGPLADVTTQQLLAGWSWSVLQRPYEVLRQFETIFDSIGYLVSDASQAVYKIRGLFEAISSGRRSALQMRIQLLEETRSVLRAIALDAGDKDGKNSESFERMPTSFAGLSDVMDRFMLRLCAAFDVPPHELFGQGGGGLNAAGEAEAATRKWHESNRSRQKKQVAPRLRRAYHLLSFAKGCPLRNAKAQAARWSFDFAPLQSPTDLELAQTRLANAQRDQIYVDLGVVKPEEIAVDLGEVYPHLDVESREEALEAGTSHEPYPEDEPDAPPGIPGANGATGEGGTAIPPIAGAQIAAPASASIASGAAPAFGRPELPPAPTPTKKPAAKAPSKSKNADAHDPARARGTSGTWAEEQATGASRDANLASAAASGPETHKLAAVAHAKAAGARRTMADRHKAVGNLAAARKHSAAAAAHDRKAGEHITAMVGAAGGV